MPPSTTPTSADESSAQKPEPERKTEMLTTSTIYSESKKIANGCYIRSKQLDAGGHSWYIVYYPNGRLPGTTASISLYFQLDTHAAAGDEEEEDVRVRVQFYLLGSGGGLRFISAEVTGTVNSTRNSIGFERFVTREDLEMSGCVSNDWINMRCDVTVLAPTDPAGTSSVEMVAPPAVAQEPCSVNTAPSSPPQEPSGSLAKEASSEMITSSSSSTVPTIMQPPPGLTGDLERLLATKEGADMYLEVGGKVFPAHRRILVARSPVLKEDLYCDDKENTGYMRLNNDMNSEAFDVLLHYLYTDSLPETMNVAEVESVAKDLLTAADRYDLKDLKLILENRLCRHVGVATALSTLVLAEQFHCLKLKSTCLRFIASRENTREVMATGHVEDLAKTYPAIVRELVTSVLDARDAAPGR